MAEPPSPIYKDGMTLKEYGDWLYKTGKFLSHQDFESRRWYPTTLSELLSPPTMEGFGHEMSRNTAMLMMKEVICDSLEDEDERLTLVNKDIHELKGHDGKTAAEYVDWLNVTKNVAR